MLLNCWLLKTSVVFLLLDYCVSDSRRENIEQCENFKIQEIEVKTYHDGNLRSFRQMEYSQGWDDNVNILECVNSHRNRVQSNRRMDNRQYSEDSRRMETREGSKKTELREQERLEQSRLDRENKRVLDVSQRRDEVLRHEKFRVNREDNRFGVVSRRKEQNRDVFNIQADREESRFRKVSFQEPDRNEEL